MPNHTRNRWTQDTPNTDGQIFCGPGSFGLVTTTNEALTLGSGGSNFAPIYYNLNTGAVSYGFAVNLQNIIRTGMFATPSLDQQQFGTAALQPGPSSVAGTSDPLAIKNFPPYKNANNPIYGGVSGPLAKGIQLNWVDAIYAPGANALAAVNIAVSNIVFTNNAAPVVTSLIAYGANGLPVAAQANPYVSRVNIANPAFVTSTDTITQIYIQFTTGGIATTFFYGLVLGVSFNFN